MKVWGIIATILLIASLVCNAGLFLKFDNLSDNVCDLAFDLHESLLTAKIGEGSLYYPSSVSEAIGSIRGDIATIDLVSQKIIELWRDNQTLKDENQRLKSENQQFKAAIIELQEEAEAAQKYNSWGALLQLIFSLF